MLFIFALAISCGGGGGGGSGGSSGGSGQSGDFFVATVESNNNTIEFNAVTANTQIGFSEIMINILDNLSGDFFRISIDRPDEVPAEVLVGDVFFPEFQFQVAGTFFASGDGSVLITELSNDRVRGDFDVLAINQLSGEQARAIGAFSLPSGVVILQ